MTAGICAELDVFTRISVWADEGGSVDRGARGGGVLNHLPQRAEAGYACLIS
jgi:hypothetical protein